MTLGSTITNIVAAGKGSGVAKMVPNKANVARLLTTVNLVRFSVFIIINPKIPIEIV
ncbi:hypothetical protein KAN5_10390 [Pseudoalteromonas sp. KAN5]|nr:hypothetical protein KAN5_10390 [Pseudoalteromonas sp. KAN5]